MAIHRHNRASPSPLRRPPGLSIPLKIAGLTQSVDVHANVSGVQTDSAALGRVVDGDTVTRLPLVTRNYTQIAVLSPGVSAGVFNAGELGSGGMPLSQISGSPDGIFVHGARSSAAALGKLFGGKSGALGGVAVNSDGPNINPAALELLNYKLSGGSYLISTPQTIDPTAPFASQGLSAFSEPCSFDEDQFSTDFDYLVSLKSKIAGRFFFTNDNETVTFPGNGLNPIGNAPGFPSPFSSGYRVFSLAHTYTFSNTKVNEARFGYVRTSGRTSATAPFSWSSVGVAEGEMSEANELPSVQILGSLNMTSGYPRRFAQNSFVFGELGKYAMKHGMIPPV